tara:strand:+ start:385 stop:738 length:354 start_codon:yes stop_codon:yes gene_type:complete
MLDSDITKGKKKQDQKQFSISDGSLHNKQYPFLMEFSELIDDMSTKDLKNNLLTDSQKMLAESLWMSNRTKKEADPEFKPKINKLREFFIQALITDHKRQWDEYKKSANIVEDNILK